MHTRPLTGARPRAIGRIIETTAPFAAAYGTIRAWPSKALTDAVCTMTPRPATQFSSLIASSTMGRLITGAVKIRSSSCAPGGMTGQRYGRTAPT